MQVLLRLLRITGGAMAALQLLVAGPLTVPAAAQTGEPMPLSGARFGLDDSARERERDRSGTARRPVRPGSRPLQRTPVTRYGNPPGSGAGTTGFISAPPPPAGQFTRRQTPPAPARVGETASLDARPARPGSSNTGPSRPGASIDLPGGTVTPLIRRRRASPDDPFEPLGIRVGAFLFRPAVELTGGYDSNASRGANGSGSSLYTVAPELLIRSNWSRHALNADLRGSYSAYPQASTLNRPFFDGRVTGRLDISRQSQADMELRSLVSTDNPGSPDLPAGLARLPLYATLGATTGYMHRFNRFEVTAKASVDRTTYEDSQLTDGSTASNRDRNFNQYAGQLRLAYDLLPGVKPFGEAQYDVRERDLPVDNFGVQRNSRGTILRAGTSFEISRKLTGEMSLGYAMRHYADPGLPELRGLVVDGTLVWAASGLTTVRLTARSTADESTLPGVAGVLRRDAGIQIDHDFRRWLTATLRYGYGTDTYQGDTRLDHRQVAAAAITYRMNREVHVKGELRQEWLRSNSAGSDYDATIALIGLRLQR